MVIPTLNEEASLPATLISLQGAEAGEEPPEQIIVADCGSTDRTREIAEARGVRVVTGETLRSRAAALRAGAERAIEDAHPPEVLWFLHADTTPCPSWRWAIETTLADPAVVAGAFTHRFDVKRDALSRLDRLTIKSISLINRCRYRITRNYYGDQGIFVRSDAYLAAGGVPDVPLLEDVELCQRLRRLGRTRLAPHPARITTSARRFVRHGPVRQFLIDWSILAAHAVGVRPARLYHWYNREKE